MKKNNAEFNKYRTLCKELNPLYDYIQRTCFHDDTIYSISSRLKNIYIDFERSYSESLEKNLDHYIDYFSICDHLFFINFLSKVTTEEDHAILIHAISNIGRFLSCRFQNLLKIKYNHDLSSLDQKKALFVIKGPFHLAHMSFVKSFLYGRQLSKSRNVDPYFIFLDEEPPAKIKSISYNLSGLKPSIQLRQLKKIIINGNYGTLIWQSVTQNLSLFMGSRFTKQQIFWSARYRNVLFSSIDKYFFGAREHKSIIKYNGTDWRYGRFFVAEWKGLAIINKETSLSTKDDQQWSSFIKRKKSQGYFICATISNSRKIKSKEFHSQVVNILKNNPNVYYFYTSGDSNCLLEKLLMEKNLANRFKRISWISRMNPILSLFDLILDSYPVGASHALCYSVLSGTPFISMISAQNLQSSLFETIAPIVKSKSLNLVSLGFVSSPKAYLELFTKLCSENENNERSKLLANQYNLFKICLANPIGMYNDFSEHIIQ